LHPDKKQAHILQQINRDPKQSMAGRFLQQMREQLLGLKEDERITRRVSLGERAISGKKLIGYRMSGPSGQFDIWGDQNTGWSHSIISNKEVARVRSLLATGFAFPLQLPAKTEAAYAGKGVHREEAEKPIFWYKPADVDKVRVVYADLSVVDAAQSPAVEGAQNFARGQAAPNGE